MRFLAVVGVALALAPASSAGKAAAPCLWLTNAEVSKALGFKVVSRDAGSTRQFRTACTWSAAAMGFFRDTPQLVVGVTPMSQKLFGRWRAQQGDTGVSGLGTDAYLPPVPKNDVEVWKNGLAISIQFSLASPTVKTLIGVAQLAVKRA